MYSILFVCTGNICRSPTAEGIMRHHLSGRKLHDNIHVDSAGTHGYHIGEASDARTIQTAMRHGVSLDQLRARKISSDDFSRFNLILALDHDHLRHLDQLRPEHSPARLELFLPYAGIPGHQEVPDPYYGSLNDFELVYTLVESGVISLLDKLQEEL